MWVILFVVAAVGATSLPPKSCPFAAKPAKDIDCGAHASFVLCPPNCPRSDNCSNLWSKIRCEDDGCCYPSCRCDEGYLRDATGKCVTVQECMNTPNRQCTPNEVRVPCPITCPPQSCDADYVSYLCAQKSDEVPCEPGCNCKDQYKRNTQGLCIPVEECPPPPWFVKPRPIPKPTPKPVNPIICGPNEEKKDCRTICPPQNCNNSYTDYAPCSETIPCEPGCDCKKDYLRDNNGVCVLNDKCPSGPQPNPITCGPNEEKKDCRTICPPQNCNNSYTDYAPCSETIPCEPGCDCIKDYLRDNNGVCVLNDKCPSGPQPPTIEPPVDENTPPSKPTKIISSSKAYSKSSSSSSSSRSSSYSSASSRSSSTGFKNKPKLQKCGVNEKWVPVRTICPPQSCAISYTSYLCEPPPPREPGCDCIENYLRDNNGVCVLNEKCPPPPVVTESPITEPPQICSPGPDKPKPQKCGVNEKWVPCRSICPPQSCAISYTSYLCEPPPSCEPGCDCIENYLRDNNGICVLNEKCPPPPVVPEVPITEPPQMSPPAPGNQCGANQTEVPCKVECPDSYCPENDSRGILICDPPDPCPSGCVCRLGYRRKSYKDPTCILAEECPPVACTRQNEEWSPCPSCLAEDCGDVNSQPTVCNELVHNCYPKCVCRKGFFRNGTGDCVPASECPPPVEVTTLPPEASQCSVNQTYVNCNVGCPTNNCPTSDTRAIVACSPPYPCPPGCACKIGYRRKSFEDKSCILAEECTPVKCTRPHEKWNPCPSPCLSERCGDQNKPPVICNELIKNCQPKCVCEDGYYRNENDICVPANQCPTKECPTNQTYVSCNVRCPTEDCPVSDNRFIYACAIAYPCDPGCACSPGYRRENSTVDNCIRAEDCPPVTCTRQNEEYNRCPSPCYSEYCKDANKPPSPCNLFVSGCDPKCVCKEGFFRNGTDDCVPVNECPPECNTNEMWNTCPSPCLAEYCLDSKNPPMPCDSDSSICQPARCVCKPGFFRDDSGTCVPFSECGKGLCNANETYAFCKAGCPYDFCPEDDGRGIIACDPPYPCPKGCICKLNYKKRSYQDQTCIRVEECPPVKCTRPNEKWDPCTSSCLAESCRDYLNPPGVCNEFVKSCQPKCVCEKGFYRNDEGICVPAKQCGVKQCGKNETIAECNFACPPDFCPADDDQVTYACKPPRDCPPGCKCKLNYKWRSYEDKTCVLARDCPRVNCTRPNEEWNPCTTSCLAEKCEDYLNPAGVCNELVEECQPKCACKRGFFRNESGECIPAKKCGVKKCGVNETLYDCGFVCPHEFCPKNDNLVKILCKPPRDCVPGCKCKLNYKWRSSKDKTCVLAQDCKPVNCTRPNEKWSECPSPCLRESCADVNNQPKTCNYLVQNCQPRCICEKGFFRNNDGICVRASKCPKIKKLKSPPVSTEPAED